MKLLVTGGAGFIGSNFIHYWLAEHPEDFVRNFDALTYAGNLESLADIVENPRYEFMRGDITDASAVALALQDMDTVVHFAAESHNDRAATNPGIFVQTNVVGTYTLLEAARQAGIKRFHHVSTDEVYGSLELGSDNRFNELTPYDPRSAYSASKAGSDHLARAYFHTFGLPVTVSNTSNNYGPYQHPEKFLPTMISNAANNRPLPVYGDGLNVRDWIHVLDHCRGIDAVLQRGVIGDSYCLGNDTEWPNIDVVHEILKILGKPESLISYVKDRPGHDRRYATDSSKARQELGWSCEYGFVKGLRQTIEWYVANQEWVEKVRAKEA